MKLSRANKVLIGGSLALVIGVGITLKRERNDGRRPASLSESEYHTRIQPIFDRRCIVCHSCYNSPCQLNLTAYEGTDRGASKEQIYEPQRLTEAHTTRLFEDAQTTGDWQERLGFFTVTQPTSGLAQPIMQQLLAQKANYPQLGGVFVPEESHSCPKDQAELSQYLAKRPEGGMPFGFPALSQEEYETLQDWLGRGAPGPDGATLERLQRPSNGDEGEAVLAKWESFLNGQDAKTRISARYIYEHLFLAHVRFDGIPGDFFRLVRSRTPTPQAVDEIPTTRPYDDPHGPFFYRFRRITSTIVRKTHTTYLLSDSRLKRYHELFIDTPWANSNPQVPSYRPEIASNPFVAFQDMPARSRYQFLLDDAFYHVMTFIRGPVCKGQVALNVIDAHFYIMFLKPDSDLTVTHPEFLPSVSKYLKLPAQGGDGAKALYVRYKYDQLAYLSKRQKLYKKFGSQGRALTDIWDGDGSNDNAILTVYRHFDSADVLKGAHGGIPKTAWVLDYPIFERIYYNLVAGFDVYGNMIHQLSTRMYMDNLRVEGEDDFLTFLPKAARARLRDTWYRGALADATMHLLDPLYEGNIETQIHYSDPAHAKEEFLGDVLTSRLNPQVRGPDDRINAHPPHPSDGDASSDIKSEEDLDKELAKVTKTTGDFAQVMPEVSLVRIRTGENQGTIYTIFHNKAFKNVRFMFTGDLYREPLADDLHIIKGVQGSYPNFFFDVPIDKVGDFLNRLKSVSTHDSSFGELVDLYGIRRLDPRFWAMSDWFNEEYRREEPGEAGVLDISRYENL